MLDMAHTDQQNNDALPLYTRFGNLTTSQPQEESPHGAGSMGSPSEALRYILAFMKPDLGMTLNLLRTLFKKALVVWTFPLIRDTDWYDLLSMSS